MSDEKPPEQENQTVTQSMIEEAGLLIGLEFTSSESELMIEGVNENLASYEKLREVNLNNAVPPAIRFDPGQGESVPDPKPEKTPIDLSHIPPSERPDDLEALAFSPVSQLARLIQTRRVTSVELTEMYLNRLKKYGDKLECVISLTEERAMEQAKRADEEIEAGNYRGPLHGIPWGAKDLLATGGTPTTWGATSYKDQVLDMDATVVQRLDEAGAVLVAKLTTGALAWGDVWYGGQTKNPWNREEGASGSSAGPASATAGGLVGFSIGSETLGSIVSPSTRCRVSGLRPTFGRVSRHGAMALSWTMDKLGPISRTVEDCALVFDAIYGPDEHDPTTARDYPFHWPAEKSLKELRIGYIRSAFEEETEGHALDKAVLDVLRSLGIDLIPIELPTDFPVEALHICLLAEAAAAFDDLTRSGQDDLLVRQIKDAWPNVFRVARLIPAVEYIQANRIRTQVMEAMAELMKEVDVYVSPSFVGHNLLLTNLTGHPAVVVPNASGLSHSITFTGKLYGEAEVLTVAQAYQEATEFHLTHPNLDDPVA